MWLLGYAGVIPFIVLFMYLYQDIPFFIDLPFSLSLWLGIYAALILSFLGAISWGVAISQQQNLTQLQIRNLLIYGVTPSLLAWFALLLPIKMALFVLSALIICAYIVDLRLLQPFVNSHYMKLRLHLSIAVSLLLALSGWVAS